MRGPKLVLIMALVLVSKSIVAEQSIENWQKRIVKVVSYPCDALSPRYEGTGFVYGEESDGVNIITSEHVLVPESNGLQKNCFKVKHPQLGEHSVDVTSRQFSSGLAILKLRGGNSFPKETVVFSDSWTKSSNFVALGYPKDSDKIQFLQNGQGLSYESRRAFIPDSENLTEVVNLPVEFGMSGGLLLSKSGDKYAFAGVLSHQYLKREPGEASLVAPLKGKSPLSSSDIAIAIQPSDIDKWVKGHSSGELQSAWKRTLDQSSSEELLENEAMQFRQIPFSSEFISMGGADGSGIGGETSMRLEEGEILGLEVRLNRKYLLANPSFEPSSEIMQNWYRWLLAGETLTVIQLMDGPDRRTRSLSSFDEFITLWDRDGYSPLVYRGSIDDFDERHIKFLKKTRMLQETIHRLQNSQVDDHLKSWSKRLSESVLMAENLMTSVQDLKKFSSHDLPEIWNQLYLQAFDLALELESRLQEVWNEI